MKERNSNDVCWDGQQPGAFLMMALRGDAVALRKLIEAGNDPNARGPKGNTALMLAVWKGHEEAVRLLIAAGSNVCAADDDGSTALDLAREAGHTKIVEILQAAIRR
jgi:ankyrin repeat protein